MQTFYFMTILLAATIQIAKRNRIIISERRFNFHFLTDATKDMFKQRNISLKDKTLKYYPGDILVLIICDKGFNYWFIFIQLTQYQIKSLNIAETPI